MNLVDKLQTSDEYLLNLLPKHDVYVINTRKRPTFGEKLGLQAAQMAESLIPTVIGKLADSLVKANSSLVQMRDPKF